MKTGIFHTSVRIIISSVLIISCNGTDTKNTFPGKFSNEVKDYKVLNLKHRPATVNEGFPAMLMGQQVIEIRPKVDGYIDAIYVSEGAQVRKGQLLFRISNPQYEQEVITAGASIKSAEADVDAAKMQVEKVKPLVEKDIVSKYELESAQFTLKAKEATLAQAKAALTNANTNVGYTTLHSPADGVIGLIPYKVGALVSSTNTSPLTMLSNNLNVFAYYSFNEKQLLQFFSGIPGISLPQKVSNISPATLVLADGTIYPQKGKIELASGIIATETGSVTFKAIFPNPLGVLRSGASGTVRVPKHIDTALVIPQSATYELQDKRLVYILHSDSLVSSSAITTIPTDNGKFFIVTSGLNEGDIIVLEGLISLRDKQKIIPRPSSADSVYANLQ